MPGSKQNMSGNALRTFVKQKFGRTVRVITLKPGMRSCFLLDSESGRCLLEARSNYALAEILTSPNFDLQKLRTRKRGFGVEVEALDINTRLDNEVVALQRHLRNFMELVGAEGLPRIRLVEDEITVTYKGLKFPLPKKKGTTL